MEWYCMKNLFKEVVRVHPTYDAMMMVSEIGET